jgi:hypothetical protein
LVLILLSTVLLLVGGGFGPPLLGVIVGLAAMRIGSRSQRWRGGPSLGLRRLLARSWPWAFACGLVAWLMLAPGLSILAYSFGVDDPALVLAVICAAFSSLLLAVVTGFARDAETR